MSFPQANSGWVHRRKKKCGVIEGPRHRVTISESFAVGKHEVTRGQYAVFAGLDGGTHQAVNVGFMME